MLVLPSSGPAEEAEVNQTLKVTSKQLKRAAHNSLWRLKKAVEKDGFYSARVALNVWRSCAIDAGLFDQSQYNEFKQQIYEKSVISNLNCFEISLLNENYTDAQICLHTWKIHSEVLGTFDQAFYDEMKSRLETTTNTKKE